MARIKKTYIIINFGTFEIKPYEYFEIPVRFGSCSSLQKYGAISLRIMYLIK